MAMTNEEGILKVKSVPAQSNTLAGVATALGGTALLGVAGQAVGNTVSRYLGNIGANIGALSGTLPGVAPVVVPAPSPFYGGHSPFDHGGHVTEHELKLVREITDEKTKNATLTAEKNASEQIVSALSPVYAQLGAQKDTICEQGKELERVKAAITIEAERRECGDERILDFVKCNYIPAKKKLDFSDLSVGVRGEDVAIDVLSNRRGRCRDEWSND